VADRDRRHPDHAAARRDAAEARLGDAAVLPGVKPAIVDAEGQVLEGACSGNLVLPTAGRARCAPSIGDPQRFIDTYFAPIRASYFTGDGCRRDEDGYYWITGRVDDVINVSGHRIGTAEVESALVAHHRSPKPAWSAIPTTSRARASTPTSR
jgi:acetyl-CoA synthetase